MVQCLGGGAKRIFVGFGQPELFLQNYANMSTARVVTSMVAGKWRWGGAVQKGFY